MMLTFDNMLGRQPTRSDVCCDSFRNCPIQRAFRRRLLVLNTVTALRIRDMGVEVSQVTPHAPQFSSRGPLHNAGPSLDDHGRLALAGMYQILSVLQTLFDEQLGGIRG